MNQYIHFKYPFWNTKKEKWKNLRKNYVIDAINRTILQRFYKCFHFLNVLPTKRKKLDTYKYILFAYTRLSFPTLHTSTAIKLVNPVYDALVLIIMQIKNLESSLHHTVCFKKFLVILRWIPNIIFWAGKLYQFELLSCISIIKQNYESESRIVKRVGRSCISIWANEVHAKIHQAFWKWKKFCLNEVRGEEDEYYALKTIIYYHYCEEWSLFYHADFTTKFIFCNRWTRTPTLTL